MNNKKNILSFLFILLLYPPLLRGRPFFISLQTCRQQSKEWFDKYKIYPIYASLICIVTFLERHLDDKLYEYRSVKYPHLHENEERDRYLPPYQ